MIAEVFAYPPPIAVEVAPKAVLVFPDHTHCGSAVADPAVPPAVEQEVCAFGAACTAVLHEIGAASKYLHAVPQAEPVDVKLEAAT